MLRFTLAFALLMTTHCSPPQNPPETDGTVSTDATRVTSPDGSSAAPPPADNVSYTGMIEARTGSGSLSINGTARSVYLYVPSRRASPAPLVIAYHGTGGNPSDFLDELEARAVADEFGFLVALPQARGDGALPNNGVNPDHEEGGQGWDLSTTDTTANEDLALTRAIMQEGRTRWNIDPTRVYTVGHSNGGFMSYFAAISLSTRIAAFAENAAGLITCRQRIDCPVGVDRVDQCSTLVNAPEFVSRCGSCQLSANRFPSTSAMMRVPPGYLQHNSDDDTVSPLYTCRLGELLGARAQVRINPHARSDDPRFGHSVSDQFFARAWAFLSPKTLAD